MAAEFAAYTLVAGFMDKATKVDRQMFQQAIVNETLKTKGKLTYDSFFTDDDYINFVTMIVVNRKSSMRFLRNALNKPANDGLAKFLSEFFPK